MKNCFEREHLFAYALEMLEAQDKLEVRQHVAECPRCRGVLEEYRQLDRVLGLWQPLEPSPWFDARVRSKIPAGEESLPSLWGRVLAGLGWSRCIAPAVVTMMVVVVSAVMVERLPDSFTHRTGGANAGSPPNAPSQASTPEMAEERTGGAATLDDYDMLASFDVLSELPKPGE